MMPRIPYIGNNWFLLSFFIPTTRYLAMYRALSKQGRTVEDARPPSVLDRNRGSEGIPKYRPPFHGVYLVFSTIPSVNQEMANPVTSRQVPGSICD